jgi:hypothetical protein
VLVMIANIERQFLRQSDLREIHYYWGKHRDKNSMLTHLRLQRLLALGIAGLVLGIHFAIIIVPLLQNCFAGSRLQNSLPWIFAVIGLLIWRRSHKLAARKYEEFLHNSPGKLVDTTGIEYGIGHPPHSDDSAPRTSRSTGK